VAPIVIALDEAGLAVESLDLLEPTLDDVFVATTGQHLEGDDQNTADGSSATPPGPSGSARDR
jgi:ABC-2 type transport system ATP-binding protein